jgi:hypothetical protein
MHERQAALIRAIISAALLMSAWPAAGQRDAAVKAQEGDINHWIEYYRTNGAAMPSGQRRSEPPSSSVPSSSPSGSEAAESERKPSREDGDLRTKD